MDYSIWVILHVLLLVFWLGTDVGVFLSAKYTEHSDLSVETRATALKIGMILDRMPRSALTLIFPSGLELATRLGLLTLPGWALPVIWVISLGWLAFLWAGFLHPQTALEKKSMLFNFVMHIIMTLLVGGFGLYLLLATDKPTWLAIKVLATGLIYVTGIILDVMFKPAVDAFMAIIAEGGSPERDARYSRAIGPVYNLVLVIYALVIIAMVMGISKPF
jgi:hypothetical protein